ncbi:magnesium/cobalt transporter CorA [Candidatus Chloroploca sp. M-50]|uniref:Magnesium transport protein CorA n=2 Tax=Candidatus Chloroploca mongolica TaxID=2528176 RepID=A0ABS4DG00_9CHLR|nr:magnesium/cobalt transporter CorA [Candidatus Chloroploca mongolica]
MTDRIERAALPDLSQPRRMILCQRNGQITPVEDLHAISDLLMEPDVFIWVDMQNPEETDIQLLREEFLFHPLTIEDATRHHERPKLDAYEHYYFLVFYAIGYDPEHARLVTQALNLFVGSNYIVSIHAGTMAVLDQTLARWQHNEQQFNHGGGGILYELLDAMVDDYFPVIDELAERIETIEEQIFARFSENVVRDIFALKRELLHVRRIVAPQRDLLNILIRRDVPIFERTSVIYLQDIYDHIVRITDSIDTYRELLSSALDAFLSVQSNQLNQIVKVLTITSIILMSAALIAGIYGMNFAYMPELQWRFGYVWALALMIVTGSGLLIFFRSRKWL